MQVHFPLTNFRCVGPWCVLMLATFIVSVGFVDNAAAQRLPDSFEPINDRSHYQLSITGELTGFQWKKLRHKYEIFEWEMMTHSKVAKVLELGPDAKEKLDKNTKQYDAAYKKLKAALKGRGSLRTAETNFARVARKASDDWAKSLSKEQIRDFKILLVRRELLLAGVVQTLEHPKVDFGVLRFSNIPQRPAQLVAFSKAALQRTDSESRRVFSKYVDLCLAKCDGQFKQFAKEYLNAELPSAVELELILIHEGNHSDKQKESSPIDLDWINTGLLYRLDSLGRLQKFRYSGYSGLDVPIATLIADQRCLDALDIELLPHQIDAINPVYAEYLNQYGELMKTLSRSKEEKIRERLESEVRALGAAFNKSVKQTLLDDQWKQLEKIALRRMLYQEGMYKVLQWLASRYEKETQCSISFSDLHVQSPRAAKYLETALRRLCTESIQRLRKNFENQESGHGPQVFHWLELGNGRPNEFSLSLFTKSCRDYLKTHE